MKSKKSLVIISTIVLLVVCMTLFTACSFDYSGKVDSQNIGGMTVGEKILFGLQVTLLGLGTVFVVLAILILLINLMRIALTKGLNVLNHQMKNQTEPHISSKKEPIKIESNNDEDEIAVAISAAIASYLSASVVEEERSNLKFKVRKVTRIN